MHGWCDARPTVTFPTAERNAEIAGLDTDGLDIDGRDNEGPDNEGPIVTKLPRRCRFCQRINS